MIAPSEYQLAIVNTVDEVVAISRDDLSVEIAGLFGFNRTGADLKQEIERQTAALIKSGKIVLDGNVLRPVSSKTH